MKEKLIIHSTVESESLGINIARCNQSYFDEKDLFKSILEGAYDVCRLKVASEDEFAPLRMSQMGMPYFFSGSIRRYRTPIKNIERLKFKHDNLIFETYERESSALLFEMLKDTWGAYPIGYYRTPILESFISKEMEIKSVFNFYKENNLPENNPNNSIRFIKHNGVYVGFFALNIVGNHLESHIGGILKAHRDGGYFHDMLVFIKKYCLEHGLAHFVFGARNENAEVQRIFHFAGFLPVGSENVFHIVPLISKVRKFGTEANGSNIERPLKKYFIGMNRKINDHLEFNKKLVVDNFSFDYNYERSNSFLNGIVTQMLPSN